MQQAALKHVIVCQTRKGQQRNLYHELIGLIFLSTFPSVSRRANENDNSTVWSSLNMDDYDKSSNNRHHSVKLASVLDSNRQNVMNHHVRLEDIETNYLLQHNHEKWQISKWYSVPRQY